MKAKDRQPDFEKSLQELEGLVDKLEQGELPLEESLRVFERGVRLTQECQQSLKSAQAKVSILTQRDGKAELEDFASDEDDA
jgi:exodeoxyribonuclease VII small subunit